MGAEDFEILLGRICDGDIVVRSAPTRYLREALTVGDMWLIFQDHVELHYLKTI